MHAETHASAAVKRDFESGKPTQPVRKSAMGTRCRAVPFPLRALAGFFYIASCRSPHYR